MHSMQFSIFDFQLKKIFPCDNELFFVDLDHKNNLHSELFHLITRVYLRFQSVNDLLLSVNTILKTEKLVSLSTEEMCEYFKIISFVLSSDEVR